MTVSMNLSESTSGVDTTQYLVEGGIVDGFTVNHLSFRSEPFTIRYREVISVDEDGNKTFGTLTYDIPAYNDVYLNGTPYSKPTTSLLPIYSPDADDVFYIHGTFGEAPKIEDFLRSDVYADSNEERRNFEIALADFEAFYNAQQDWLNSVLASPVNEVEYRDDTESNGIHASITFSESLTVEDIRDWIDDYTVTFQLGGDTLFSQPLEVTGTQYKDTLQGGTKDDTIDGGADNDIIILSEGADDLVGGAGSDSFDVSSAETKIEANLSDGNFSFSKFSGISPITPANLSANVYRYSGSEGSLSSIEFLNGTDYDDVIIGRSETNKIDGGEGSDFIVSNGRSSSTELIGQAGNDFLVGGKNSDHLVGGQEDDVLYSWNPDATSPGNKDTLDGGDGEDTYYVDGFANQTVYSDKSSDFISDWEVGEKVYWFGSGAPIPNPDGPARTTVFANGKQHISIGDDNGNVVGGFSWGNGLGTSGNRSINANTTMVSGENAIEFVVKDEKPTAIEELRQWVTDNRALICTGKTLIEGIIAVAELRAQAGKIAQKGLAQSFDPDNIGDSGLAKYMAAWFPDLDSDLVADAIEDRHSGIISQYYELAEKKLIEKATELLTAKGLLKASAKKIIDALSQEYCPPLPEESFFVKIGELALSPIPIASAVLGIGKSLIESSYTYATAEADRIQREKLESLDSGIEIIFNKTGLQSIEPSINDKNIEPTNEEDTIILGPLARNIIGDVETLNGDRIINFSFDDSISFLSSNFSRGNLNVTFGSAILDIDTDQDGVPDTQITLEGDFSSGDFMAVLNGTGTQITFETFLPALQEGQALDPNLVNGIINQNFLKGDGSSDFQVTLRDMGFAGYSNVVGVYEIDASGNIVDTRILFENANADKSAVAGITDVEAGNKLGFFLVQDAADWAATLADGDTLSFVNSFGAAANISNGSDISITVNGAAVDEMVFHSFSEDMNSDGVQHALSGVDIGGQSISVGFEDLTGGGDQDYEDVVFRVEVVDDFMFV